MESGSQVLFKEMLIDILKTLASINWGSWMKKKKWKTLKGCVITANISSKGLPLSYKVISKNPKNFV